MQQLVLEADPAALDLAETMIAREDVRRAILEETLASAEAGTTAESGRTVCGRSRSVLGPLSRSYARVTLPTCPVGVSGTWHTHITRDQFLNPVNSLPDFANVAFGIVDVSIVAGADTSHVVVATGDRATMQELLVDELGVDVDSPADVAHAVISGDVRDPPAVRRALYARLGDPIAFRVGSAEPDLADRARSVEFAGVTAREPAPDLGGCVLYHRLLTRRDSRMERVLEQGRRCQESVHETVGRATASDFDFRQQVLATTVSVTVGNVIERVLFG